MKEKMTGIVKWYSKNRNFGFITSTKNAQDYFMHKSEIKEGEEIITGDKVDFVGSIEVKGLTATNVKKIKE